MQISKHKQVLLIAWLLTLTVWLPPVWYYFFRTDYFLDGFRGLQIFLYSSIYLLIILGWTVLLTIPKYRTEKFVVGAGTSFLTIGFLLNTYAMFKQTPGFLIMFAGVLLLLTVRGGAFKQHGSAVDQPAVKVIFDKNNGLIYSLVAIAFLGMPWLWVILDAPEFLIRNVRGLLDFAVAGPPLMIMTGCALWLSFPSRRTVNANCAAASTMLVIALFLFWFFSHVGSTGFTSIAMFWMANAYRAKSSDAHKPEETV